jgi:UDP-2,3-diacylglucosamine pyrophosphatase LpxH
VEKLRPLIAGAGTVIFNGDTWQELAAIFREKSAAMLEDLKELCREEGILITHGDAFFAEGSPWSREAFARHAEVAELWKRHGAAAADPAKRIELAREIALVLRAATYPKGRRIWQRVMEAIRPPRRAYEILRVWTKQADVAADFASRYFPNAQIMVKGHFHRTGIWRRQGKLVVNLGAFLPPCPAWWAEYEGGYFRVGKIEEGEAYRMGTVLGVWRVAGG